MKTESSQALAWNMVWGEYRKKTILVIIFSLFLIIPIPFMPLVVFFIWYIYIFSKAQKLFMKEFAVSNGMEYAEKADIKSVEGRLFNVGHSKHITNVASGKYKNHPVRFFNYRYTVGSGKNSQTHKFTVFEVSFEKTSFPHILLHSKTMWSRYGSVDVWGSDRDVEVSLEDAHKDFRLYVTQDYEIEALQLFTPEVLGFLGDEAKQFSIECAGNRIYVYDNQTFHTKKELMAMYKVVHKLFDNIGGLADRLSDDFESLHEVYRQKK